VKPSFALPEKRGLVNLYPMFPSLETFRPQPSTEIDENPMIDVKTYAFKDEPSSNSR
jgi:hypothetical protein